MSTTSSTTSTSTTTTASTATSTTAPNTAYCLFRNTNIPENVEITKAHLYLTGYQTSPDVPLYSHVCLSAEDDPSAPVSKSDLDGRPETVESVRWDHSMGWDDNVTYKSPNLKTSLQEVISRDGWASGNNLLVMVKAFEELDHAGVRYRFWSAIEHLLGSEKARLVVHWRKPRQILTPVIEPLESFQLAETVDVTIRTWPVDANIYYTIDGTDPDENDILYTGEFEVPSTTTVKAIAQKQYWLDSDIAERTYSYYQYQPVTEYPIISSLFFINQGGINPYWRYSIIDYKIYSGKLYILANVRKNVGSSYPEILVLINGTPGLDDWAYEIVFDPSTEIVTPVPTYERFESASLTMGGDSNWHVHFVVVLGTATDYWGYKYKSGGVWQPHVKVPYGWLSYGYANEWPIYVNASGHVYYPGVRGGLDTYDQLRKNPNFNWVQLSGSLGTGSLYNAFHVWRGGDDLMVGSAAIPAEDPRGYAFIGWISGSMVVEAVPDNILPHDNYSGNVGYLGDDTIVMVQEKGSYFEGSNEKDWFVTTPKYRHGTDDWRNWFNQTTIASGSLPYNMSRWEFAFAQPGKSNELVLLYFQTYQSDSRSLLRIIRGSKGSTADIKIWKEDEEGPVPNVLSLGSFVYNNLIYILFTQDSDLYLFEEKNL